MSALFCFCSYLVILNLSIIISLNIIILDVAIGKKIVEGLSFITFELFEC